MNRKTFLASLLTLPYAIKAALGKGKKEDLVVSETKNEDLITKIGWIWFERNDSDDWKEYDLIDFH